MTKRLPTEFAIVMNLHKMMILQQSELPDVNSHNYFDENSPCHLYFVCKRSRVTINPEKFVVNEKRIFLTFQVHNKGKVTENQMEFRNNLGTTEVKLESDYPYNKFKLITENGVWLDAKVTAFLQSQQSLQFNSDFLDLKILYIGQSYGVDGARTAPDRLKSHSTLQGIYSEAIANNPDCEIWLALASFVQVNIMMMDGRTKFTEEELDEDQSRAIAVNNKLNWEGINEQQKINFTEAALIRYFQPPYNKIYKDNFPNPAHKTYSECYDLDINSICIEMHTSEMINCKMYSDNTDRSPFHMKDFLLQSEDERKSIFEIV